MGLFWDLMQQSQISEHKERANSLETRVRCLEIELGDITRRFHDLVVILENEYGRDIDGDGKIG